MSDPTVPYGTLSYWHDTAPLRPAARSLPARRRFDVAIVGGGFTGLWTAYHLLRREPTLSIAVLERQEVGFGASGRNGGFAMTKIGHNLHQMVRDYGAAAVRNVHVAAEAAVKGLAEAVANEGIDCELDYGGLLTVATNDAQIRKLRRDIAVAEELELDTVHPLDAQEVQSLVHSPTYRLALAEDHCAVLHPAKLARGLANVCVDKGVELFERVSLSTATPEAGGAVTLETSVGPVLADQVVLATNAWAGEHKAFSGAVMPLYTYIIGTEPIPDETWAEIGWEQRQGIEDKREHLHYYRRTRDGRILFGGHDNVNTWRSRILTRYDRNERIFGLLRKALVKTFPQLENIRITHGWGGPVGMTPNFLPQFGSLSRNIHYGYGYNGHGVGPSYLGGEILTDLIVGDTTERTSLLFVRRPGGKYPPEPIRFVGGYLATREALWYDDAGEAGRDFKTEPRLLKYGTKVFGRAWR